MWTCKQWGHWGWAQSRRRRDSGSCRVCWYSVGNRDRWLCTHLYPHMSSHHASAGNQDDTCTEGAKSTGDVSKSHSLRIWPLLTFSLDRLQRRATVSQSALNWPQTCALYLSPKSFISAHFLKTKSSCCCQKCCANSCKSHLQSRLPTEYRVKDKLTSNMCLK